MASEVPAPEDHLQRFGLKSFRPGQRAVIDAVLAGDDCLCIMPTGGGKSLCYQLPSVARAGTTLVVSPLIALMKDQVDALLQLGISSAFVNSALSGSEQEERLFRFAAGDYDMLYVAPERFRSPRFREAVEKANVQLLAIDEAHCISEWGHDFRHDYARLGEFRQQLGRPQTIALTATATTDVREDVLSQLQLNEPKVFVAGFARDNLHYQVETQRSKQAKNQSLLDFLKKTPGCGIIYASTRSACEEVRDLLLNETTRTVIAYHGGLMPDERRHLQEAFMKGEAEIVVATNAFGMGIDKADVRFVVHFNIPGSLEAYYQEAGRAGRDGNPSVCHLLYSQSDRFIQEFFIDSAHPPKESIQKVYQYLCRHPDDPIELTQQDLKEQIGLSIGADGVGTCERLLEKAGVLERLDSNRNLAAIRVDADAPNLAELLPVQAKVQRRVARAVGNIVGARRFERFYFHPKDVSTLSGEDLTAVTRALRELSRHDWFDYVPPFRGRAVHMLRRDVPFDHLEIDFTRLEERRQSNLAKLDRVIRFATTRRCRQRDILRYFGEPNSQRCGHCDNCGTEPGMDRAANQRSASDVEDETNELPSVTPAMLQVTRIVLSGVARAQGRFGRNVVVGMLCGSQSAKIKKWNLDRLSTFGLLEGFKQTEVAEVIDALISLSLIKMIEVDKFRPTIHNTDLGNDVMMGRAKMVEPMELEPSLLKRIERQFRSVPAETTRAAEVQRPSGSAADIELSRPQATANDDQDANADLDLCGDAVQIDGSGGVRPNHYWTWRLLRDGYSAEECAAIRNCGLRELTDHLIRAHEEGLEIRPSWLLDEASLAWLEENFPADGDLRPLMQHLPPSLTSSLVTFFSKCRVPPPHSVRLQA